MSTPSLSGYENLELIGKGGFSRVYRAEQSKLKRKVAVKVLNFGLNEDADRLSFARETELMGRVSTHPNIVTVHDTAFTAQGQPCIVMEHYPGGSLADLINEVGRLSPREALDVGVAIASALEASHRAGILHCDLKPQNILISEFGQPALGDFGISTFAEERTRTGNEAGAGFTLPYAAPEIVEGDSPSAATDVYSLAATLYTSLSGRRPFAYPTAEGAKPSSAEHARRIMLEAVPSLVDDGVPPAIDALLAASMSKDPMERPVSAALFASTCHEIGQALGYGTSAPRIADLGALPIIDSAAIGQGQVDLSRLIKERQDLPGMRSRESGAAVEPDFSEDPSSDATAVRAEHAPPVSDRRRHLAAVLGVVAAAAVVLLIAAVAASGDDPVAEPVTSAGPGTSSAGNDGVAANPVAAPSQPQGVELTRVTDAVGQVQVSWQVPPDDLAAGDVVYEVRRTDDVGDEEWWPVTTTTDAVELPAIADDEGVCVNVLAVRSTRTAAPTDPVCLRPDPVQVVLNPARCSAPCQVSVVITEGADAGDFDARVVDRNGVQQLGSGFDHPEQFAGVDGALIQIDESVTRGDYLVVVTSPTMGTESVLLTVEPPG